MSNYRLNLLVRFIMALLIILIVLTQLNHHGEVPEYILAALATIILYYFGKQVKPDGNKEQSSNTGTNTGLEKSAEQSSDIEGCNR